MIIGRVLWTQEPPFPPRRIGKCVPLQNGEAAYIYDSPALYKRLNAYGVSETVLVEMLRDDVRWIHYHVDNGFRVLVAERDAVIEHGFRDNMLNARGGYLYYPVRAWTVQNGPVNHGSWIKESNRVDLPWRIDAPELADWKARIVAARPVPAMQMSLFA